MTRRALFRRRLSTRSVRRERRDHAARSRQYEAVYDCSLRRLVVERGREVADRKQLDARPRRRLRVGQERVPHQHEQRQSRDQQQDDDAKSSVGPASAERYESRR